MTGEDGYIIETTVIGNTVKVTAIHPELGIEASIIGAANLPKEQLAKLAIKKLRYVLEKRGQ